MATASQQHGSSTSHQGLIRKIFDLLPEKIGGVQLKPQERVGARRTAKAKVSAKPKAQTKARSKVKVKAQAKIRTSRKTKSAVKARAKVTNRRATVPARTAKAVAKKSSAPKKEHSLQNPRDVIPMAAHDPAHSPGHRKLNIEKELP
jgi:hypothetical protein